MNEDKIFELAELLADEAFGKKGMIAYSERQELTSKFNEMLVKNLTLYGVVFNEAEDCRKCLKPKRMKPNTIQMLCECVDSEVELFCRVCKSDNIKHHPEEYYECLGCGHEFTK